MCTIPQSVFEYVLSNAIFDIVISYCKPAYTDRTINLYVG